MRTRAQAALLAGAVLVAVAGCKHRDDTENPLQVWGIDVISSFDRYGDPTHIAFAGNRATIRLTVLAAMCAPEADNVSESRGYTYGHSCRPMLTDADVAEEEADYPDLRMRELKATAHVVVVAEYGAERVSPRLFEGDVGPLTMGAPFDLEPLSWPIDPDRAPPANPGPYPEWGRHRVHVLVSDCHLTNGSACANNSRRFFDNPDIDSSQYALTVPERTGSLVRQEANAAGPGSNEQPGQPGQNGPIGGVPVRRTVFGVFKAGGGLGRVAFWGAELAEPRAPDGPKAIEEAFGRAGLGASAGFAATSDQLRSYDAGPLGGQVWCQTYKYQVLKTTTFYACGWMDQGTVGTIVVNDYAVADLGLTEAGAATLLVAMRKDIEQKLG